MVGFITEGEESFAGRHLLIDLYGCRGDTSPESILMACEQAAIACGATILFSHCHPFEGGGSSGAVILAESHCTFHHWWEQNHFIAIDIFVCGVCNPYNAIPVLVDYLQPQNHCLQFKKRGTILSDAQK